MKLVTYNVNSLRARLPRLLPYLDATQPDVVCLQETKVEDDQFPAEPLREHGYEVCFHGQPSYNGVAILSRVGISDVTKGLDGPGPDERRVIGATVGDGLRVYCVYVINGQSTTSDRYEDKLRWMHRLTDTLVARHDPAGEPLVVCGDFNCTVDDRDVYDPERWRGRILCSEPERAALTRLTDRGLGDAFRAHEPSGGHYTWWDFRTRGFQRDRGLRIDHFLMSPPALAACTSVSIDKGMRADDGPVKPSDHAPVLAVLDEARLT